jgi:hypothetical protein
LLASSKFTRVTTDAFFIGVEAADPKFNEAEAGRLLQSLGALSIEPYHAPAGGRKLPWILVAGAVVVVSAALLPPLLVAKTLSAQSPSRRAHPVLDMDFQPKYLPQQASGLFADGRAMRPPVSGTVAADRVVDDDHLLLGRTDDKPATTFPITVTLELMKRGQSRYNIYCAPCHGLAGDGDGIVSEKAFEREEPKWVRPFSLYSQSVVEMPVGQLYQTISTGVRTMPGYASQIAVEDRWAIAAYVRALQRSRNATLEDVPEELRDHLTTDRPKQ